MNTLERFQVIEATEAKHLPEDGELRYEAAAWAGGVVASKSLDLVKVPIDGHSDLAVNIHEAGIGNEQARMSAFTNGITDYTERTYKFGFVTEVEMGIREDGDFEQYGQSLRSIHYNTLTTIKNAKMLERAKIEAVNGHRDRAYASSGLLKDNIKITLSAVHSEMTDEEAANQGFFVPTKSIAMQLLYENDQGKIVQESVFVASRDNESDDAFDIEALIELGKMFGIDYQGANSEEILSRPFLVKKSEFSNPSASIAKMYDQAAYEVTGEHKFFGRSSDGAMTEADYLAKISQSKDITRSMKNDIEMVVDKLIKAKPKTGEEATKLLAQFNEELLKSKIIEDETIDYRVLGEKVAWSVIHARAINSGEIALSEEMARREMQILQKRINKDGKSNSCPGGASTNDGFKGLLEKLSVSIDNEDAEEENSKPADCDFISKECPSCGDKNVKTKCRDGVYYGACGCSSDGKKKSNPPSKFKNKTISLTNGIFIYRDKEDAKTPAKTN